LRVARPRPVTPPGAAPGRAAWSLLVWPPLLVIGAGLALGIGLWAKWGFLIAFETVRAYCF